MTTYYMDTAGSNTSPYDTWAKAATDLQTLADTATAGDTIYCRGTQTLSTLIDFDTNSGSIASGYIKVIGCNGSGSVDGTRFTLDANSAVANAIKIGASIDYLWFENILIQNATASGVDYIGGYAEGHVWVNSASNSNGAHGFDLYYNDYDLTTFIRCQANNNTNTGFFSGFRGTGYFCCEAIGNGDEGFDLEGSAALYYAVGCVSHDNGGDGFACNRPALIMNCVSDENTSDGIYLNGVNSACALVVGNRITGNAYGINNDAGSVVYGWNYLDNTTAETTGSGRSTVVPYDSDTDTNETTGTEGYADGANDDFNLTSSATIRNVAIEID